MIKSEEGVDFIFSQFLKDQKNAYQVLRAQFPSEEIDIYQDRLGDLFDNVRVLMYYNITPTRLDSLLKIHKACPDFNLLEETGLQPSVFSKIVKNLKILLYKQGQLASFKLGESLDGAGSPIPWITYPAMEFLAQFDFSSFNIYEFGAGNSTLYWANRFKTVTAVETEKNWYEKIMGQKLANVKLSYFDKDIPFSESILREYENFDVIFIDSIRCRYHVTKNSIKKLNTGGIIILDNVDWYPNSSKLLRDEGFFQVDFHGFGPINGYTWTTSIFFKDSIKFKRFDKKFHPVGGIEVLLSDDGPILNETL